MKTLHRPRKSRFWLLALTVMLPLVVTPALRADDDDDDGGGGTSSLNRCAIKFVCGEASESLRAVDGTYRTAINIFNPNGGTVTYRKKLALTTPCPEDDGFEVPGDIVGPLPPNGTPFSLATMRAFDVDCNEIFNEFEAGATCEQALDFVEGFLVLESNGPLQVTSVYTAGGDGEIGGSSIDVEASQCGKSAAGGDDDDDD